jgi:hypothetical protein
LSLHSFTAITVPTNKMADDLKEAVVLFQVSDQELKHLISRCICLNTFQVPYFCLDSCVPSDCCKYYGVQQSWAMFLECINNYGWCCNRYYSTNQFILLNKHYDGLMKMVKIKSSNYLWQNNQQ